MTAVGVYVVVPARKSCVIQIREPQRIPAGSLVFAVCSLFCQGVHSTLVLRADGAFGRVGGKSSQIIAVLPRCVNFSSVLCLRSRGSRHQCGIWHNTHRAPLGGNASFAVPALEVEVVQFNRQLPAHLIDRLTGRHFMLCCLDAGAADSILPDTPHPIGRDRQLVNGVLDHNIQLPPVDTRRKRGVGVLAK